ncbi:Lrp/AsnC family transcriptional regulator [Candidatus Woesearchaeota archaeon]|nr:Lrp/AsnC family transcriptional regulator [Candidatus Woesearchaeota archaeon]
MKPSGRIGPSASLKIDARDRKILAMLAEDGRMQASDIAKKVQLSRDAVAYRIRRLQNEGIILGFAPVVDLQRFGYSTYHVFFLLDEKARRQHQAFLDYLITHANTVAVRGYTDTWDAEWSVVARSLEEFDSLLTELVTKFPDVILEKEKLAVVKRYVSLRLPYCYYPAGIETRPAKQQPKGAELDATDLRLLDLLAKDARQSTYELGRQLKLSPDAVSYRMKRLADSAYVTGYTTLFNLSKLGHSWYTYAINFDAFDAKDDAKLAEFVRKHPHIIRAVKLFGSWDVMITIVTESPENYHDTVKEIKNAFSDIVYSYQTWLAHKEYFYTMVPKVIVCTKAVSVNGRDARMVTLTWTES